MSLDMAKITALPKQKFPGECCGVCSYGKVKGAKEYHCWVSPPIPVWEDGVPDFKRGLPVDMEDVACQFFKPRCHA